MTHQPPRQSSSRRVVTLVGILGGLGVLQASPAIAAPPEPGNASCMGYEAADISPPGSNDEAPGGMPNLLEDLDAFFVSPDGAFRNRGEVIQFFTRLRAGSHEACDQALIEAVFGG